jgi:hypothetical protein
MAVTVREAKRTRTNLEEALESAAEYLGRHPEHSALAAQAATMAARLAATSVGGKEVEEADPGTLAGLREAVGIGRLVLGATDAGRKVPRLTSRVEDAEKLLGAG